MSIDFLAEEINNHACTQYEIYVVFAWIIWERGEVYYFCPIRPDLAIKNMVPQVNVLKEGTIICALISTIFLIRDVIKDEKDPQMMQTQRVVLGRVCIKIE